MNWQDCTNENKAFTTRYDGAARKLKAKLGSYDTISHHIFKETGKSVAGVSVRRWLKNRDLPIHLACVLVDLSEGEVVLADLFPWLEEYFSI